MELVLILSALAASAFTLIDAGYGPALAWIVGIGVAIYGSLILHNIWIGR